MSTTRGDFPLGGKSDDAHHPVGHAHFWERAMLSRRQFVKTSLGATGLFGVPEKRQK